MRKLASILGIVCVFPVALAAQQTAELMNRIQAMEERIKALEAEVETLKGRPAAAALEPAPPSSLPAAVPSQSAGQAPGGLPNYSAAASAKVFNPDISLIGDFLGAAGNGFNRGTPAVEMHESELGLQSIIDPYARADIFLSFGEQGVALEEGYLTFTTLPWGLLVKAGKMRAAFGKVNTLHNHALPWTDRPLLTENLVAGEEGISDAGLSLSRILPAPKNIFLEGTAQVFRGDTEGLFQASRRSDVSAVGHLRAYCDLSESANLDLGASFARGHSRFGDGSTQLYGVDATFRWKPLRRAIYRSFVARSEFIWGRVPQRPAASGLDVISSFLLAKPFGYYVSGDYQLGRRWFVGGRFDRSDRQDALLRDTGGSMLLTYWPSEFAQIRGQLRRTRYGEKLTANEILFQVQFSMGAHGAHPF